MGDMFPVPKFAADVLLLTQRRSREEEEERRRGLIAPDEHPPDLPAALEFRGQAAPRSVGFYSGFPRRALLPNEPGCLPSVRTAAA